MGLFDNYDPLGSETVHIFCCFLFNDAVNT
jgi:hypothetical protein